MEKAQDKKKTREKRSTNLSKQQSKTRTSRGRWGKKKRELGRYHCLLCDTGKDCIILGKKGGIIRLKGKDGDNTRRLSKTRRPHKITEGLKQGRSKGSGGRQIPHGPKKYRTRNLGGSTSKFARNHSSRGMCGPLVTRRQKGGKNFCIWI